MQPSSSVTQAGAARTDILLIDDSVTDLRLLMEMMRQRDLRLSVAMDGVRGFEQAVLLRPRLILLDVNMPQQDGFRVCRRLKADPLTRPIPVIFLTAANNLPERLHGFAMGGVDYIGKPFDEHEVLARVGVHLHRHSDFEGPKWCTQITEQPDDADAHLVAKAQGVLRAALADPPGLEQLARRVGVNRRRLNDAFQSVCGLPVYAWLREDRFRLAYHRVTQTDDAFIVISESLGFSTPANFSKAFRNRFGFTPSDIRAGLAGLDVIYRNESHYYLD